MEKKYAQYINEVKVWRNKELGLWYLENRAFDDKENQIAEFLDVCDDKGLPFNLGDLVESNQGKSCFDDDYKEVTVDDIEWTFIETFYDGYAYYPKEMFASACDYLEFVKFSQLLASKESSSEVPKKNMMKSFFVNIANYFSSK